MEHMSMLSSPYNIANKFCHHYRLSGHWEVKCWRLHLELHLRPHTTKRRVWLVNIEEDKELTTYPTQREEVSQGT
jgi:hypothetical protein